MLKQPTGIGWHMASKTNTASPLPTLNFHLQFLCIASEAGPLTSINLALAIVMGVSAFRPLGRTKGQAHQCSEPTCSFYSVPAETKVVPSKTPTISAALMERIPCLKPNHRTPDSKRQWFPPGQFTQLRSIGIETSLVTTQVLWFVWAVRHAAETRWQCVPWFPSPDPGSLRIDLVLNLRSSPYTTAMKMQTGWLTQQISLVTGKRPQLSRPIFLIF